LGRSVMRSIDNWENGRVDFGPAIGSRVGFVGCLLILNCWHSGQPWTYFLMKFRMPGHQ
jgi:hypothetical protein